MIEKQSCITCGTGIVSNVPTRFCSNCRKKWTSKDRQLLVDAHMKARGKTPALVNAYMYSLKETLEVDTGESEELIIEHGSSKNTVSTWAEATKVAKLLENVDLNKEWFLDKQVGAPIKLKDDNG